MAKKTPAMSDNAKITHVINNLSKRSKTEIIETGKDMKARVLKIKVKVKQDGKLV